MASHSHIASDGFYTEPILVFALKVILEFSNLHCYFVNWFQEVNEHLTQETAKCILVRAEDGFSLLCSSLL